MTFILPEEQNNRHDGTRNHAALLTDCRLLVFTIRVTQAFNSPAIFGLFCTGRQPSISITTPSLTRRYEVGTRYLQNVESRNKPWWRVWGQSPPESWSSYVERMPNAEHRVQTRYPFICTSNMHCYGLFVAFPPSSYKTRRICTNLIGHSWVVRTPGPPTPVPPLDGINQES